MAASVLPDGALLHTLSVKKNVNKLKICKCSLVYDKHHMPNVQAFRAKVLHSGLVTHFDRVVVSVSVGV